jgi:hypothetical protein
MGRKALFLVALAVFLSSRTGPTAVGAAQTRYCGDGICDDISCSHYPGDPGDGCEEMGVCQDCFPDPCNDPPNPVWVTDWGTNQWHGGYDYRSWDVVNGNWVEYCQYVSTHTVEQYDNQACVAYREPRRTVCYHSEQPTNRMYAPNQYQCCSFWMCGGTGGSCP